MAGFLQVTGINHHFDVGKEDKMKAVQDINLTIGNREFVSIVGPSGCGKSTLFNILAGLIRPASGNVTLQDQDITGQTGHVGYMLQRDCLFPWRTVVNNLIVPMEINKAPKKEALEEARMYLRKFGLDAFADEYPQTLSGGMRQRCAFIRTLLSKKEIFLLDEPFGALDSQTKLIAQEWLLSVWEELQKTVVFITHDIDEAIFLSDRVFIMSSRPGRIMEEIRIDLPRPRTNRIRLEKHYTEIKATIDETIREETLKAIQYVG